MRVLAAASVLVASVLASAQAPVPNPTNKTGVIGLMHAIHSVNDAAKTLAFYQAVFSVNGRVAPFQSTGPQILTNSPGATLQVAMTQLSGAFSFELTQFGNIERTLNQRPDIADPGAPMMKIIVRDLDSIVAAAKKENAPIITKGGEPVMVQTSIGKTRAIIMRDPDGYFVEAIQGTPAPDSPQGPVIGAIMALTVRDVDETLKYWNGILGLDLQADKSFSNDQATLDLMGLPKAASYRTAGGLISGSKARIEMIEIKGVPRKAFDLRVTDPNASGMALRIGHIRELLAKIKQNNGRVLSRNAELVEWSDTIRNVFVKDPNGLNLELVGSADPNL
ncbi:MAG TPA: VOC family protein [Terriglobia bacterium]|jgi:catechol 2,3-dioxygenase-like lactoylglutathione lyase family enzyme